MTRKKEEMMMMVNRASKARTLWAALFSVAVAAAILLATGGAASAYTPPSAPIITAPAEDSYDSDGNFTLSGIAQPHTTVKVFEVRPNDFRLDWVGTAQVDPYGRWHVKLGGVVFGKHSYKARVTDHMSNYSEWSSTRTLSVDPPQLLQKQDPIVQQAAKESMQLVEEAKQESLPQWLVDHYASITQLTQDLGAQTWFVATMPVGGVSLTEKSAAISRHAELEKAIDSKVQEVQKWNNEMQAINQEMKSILERCASSSSGCSAEDQLRLDELKNLMDISASNNQLLMLKMQNMANKQQSALVITSDNLQAKWAYLDNAIITNMIA